MKQQQVKFPENIPPPPKKCTAIESLVRHRHIQVDLQIEWKWEELPEGGVKFVRKGK